MTISLAIDTSTSRTSVAIIDEGAIVWHGHHDGATSHGSALPTMVAQALAFQNRVDQVVVGMGPGPFTGLRVGIAFALTFAQARGIAVIGVCSLDAIAAVVQVHSGFIVATDARRKELYWARYENAIRVEGPYVSIPKEVVELNLPIFGEGALKYQLTTNDEIVYPDMAALVGLSHDQGSHVTEAMYLRRPDAVPTSERKP